MDTDMFVAPGQQRSLRACMVCSIVMLQAVCFIESTELIPAPLTSTD